jgi:hypothetical protein
MFGAFRKHHKWIWVVLLIFVIPSFVIYFAPDVGTGSGGRDAINLGTIDGRPITRDEYLRARREVALFFRLFRDTWPDTAQSEEAMDNETIQRVLMLRRLKGFQVEIADDALVQHIRRTFAPTIRRSISGTSRCWRRSAASRRISCTSSSVTSSPSPI